MDTAELDRRYAEVAAITDGVSTAVAPHAMDGGMAFEAVVAPGVPTFMEAPYQPLGTEINADVAIVGLPYEGTVQIDHRRKLLRGIAGPRTRTSTDLVMAPTTLLRRCGWGRSPTALGFPAVRCRNSTGSAINDHLRVVDVGDADVRGGTMQEAWNNGAAAVAEVVTAGSIPMTLGAITRSPAWRSWESTLRAPISRSGRS